jgi:CRISPR-associated protein Csb1
VRRFLDSNMRLRTACELELAEGETSIRPKRPDGFVLPSTAELTQAVSELIAKCKSQFADPAVTELTWHSPKG